jgi:hypothetical protein
MQTKSVPNKNECHHIGKLLKISLPGMTKTNNKKTKKRANQ